jgi:hypothetical protein
MSIFKNSMASKQYIEPLPTKTMTGSAVTIKTINLETFGQLVSIVAVIADAQLSGTCVVTWYGGTTTSGGSLTAIAAMTLPNDDPTNGALQIDSEDIVEAAEVAALLPAGFKSLVLKATGTNTDTFDCCVVANKHHQYVGNTPSAVSALT